MTKRPGQLAGAEAVEVLVHDVLGVLADEFDVDEAAFGERRAVPFGQLPRTRDVVVGHLQRSYVHIVVAGAQ